MSQLSNAVCYCSEFIRVNGSIADKVAFEMLVDVLN